MKKVKSKSQAKLIATSIIISALIVSGTIAYSFQSTFGPMSKMIQGQAPTAKNAPSPTAPNGAIVKGVSVDDDPAFGPKNAKVTVVEFSDFQCPFCKRAFGGAVAEMKKEYKGKIRFVYRDFPLSFHSRAQQLAEAGECADRQGKFWQMHDKIFTNAPSKISDADVKRMAKEIGLNTSKFNKCVDKGEATAEVKKDIADGSKYGVSGTPTFFVNGRKLVGAQPFAAFKSIIDAELKK